MSRSLSVESYLMKIFSMSKKENILKKLFSVIILIGVWYILSLTLNDVIIPTPLDVFKTLLKLLAEKSTYIIIMKSLGYVIMSIMISSIIGVILGLLGSISKNINYLLSPVITIIKSLPIVSFIIILLVYIKSLYIPVICGVLLSFPIIYSNVFEGYSNINKKLISMAKFYNVDKKNMIKTLYIPAIYPYFLAGFNSVIGFSFKAVIAAEVISILDNTIGNSIYEAKVYLEYENLFAWSVIIIILALVIEFITNKIAKKIKFMKGIYD